MPSKRDPALPLPRQVSAVVPLLRLLTAARVLFYCHFPDLLLATRRSALHAAYRAPLDWAEQQSTGAADAVLVNSGFTQGEPVGLAAAGAAQFALPCYFLLSRESAGWRASSPRSSACPGREHLGPC